MKLVYWSWTCSLSVLNMDNKLELQVKKIVNASYLGRLWVRSTICEIWWNSCVDSGHAAYLWSIGVTIRTCANKRNSCTVARHAAYLCSMSMKHKLIQVTKLIYSESVMQPIGAELALETWLAPTNENMYLCSRYGLSDLNMDTKHDSRQVMNFVYWRLTYSLRVLCMSSKQD